MDQAGTHRPVPGSSSLGTQASRTKEEPPRAAPRRSSTDRVAAAVCAGLHPHEVLTALAVELEKLAPYDLLSVLRLEESQTTLEVIGSVGESASLATGTLFELEEWISSQALREGRVILRSDLEQEALLPTDRYMLAAGFRSHLVAPMVAGDEWLGTIQLARRQPEAYSQEHADLLGQIGPHVARALQRAWQLQACQRQTERLQDMARGLLSIGPRPLSEAMASVLEVAASATGAAQASFFRYDEVSNLLVLEAITTPIPGLLERARQTLVFRLGEEHGLVGVVGATRRALYVPNCQADAHWRAVRPEIRSVYMAPVFFGDRLYGVIGLLSERVNAISVEQRSLADAVATYAGSVLENARMYQEISSELERGRRRLAALEEVSEKLVLSADAEDGLQALVDAARGLLGARCGALAVWEPGGGLSSLVVSGLSPAQTPQSRAGPAALLGLVRDAQGDDPLAHLPGGPTANGLPRNPVPPESFLRIPVVKRGQSAGSLYFVEKEEDSDFSADDGRALGVFGALVGVFLENLDLYRGMARERSTLAAIQASMTEGLVVLDPGRRITHLNEAAASLMGLAVEQSLGKPIEGVIRAWAQDFEPSAEALLGVIDQCAVAPATLEAVLRPQRRELVVTAFPVSVRPAERMTGLLLRDVTQERELLRRYDAFVSMAAHELRTPLTSILGFAELLLSQDPPEAVRAEWLACIRGEAHRLAAIVDDLLNVSRIRSGKLNLKLERLALRAVVEEALGAARPATDSHDFVIDLAPDFPEVVVDHSKLLEVLTNLLDNAIKYSPAGGPVTLSARHHPERERVVVGVADHGIGIAPGDQQRIFSMFERVGRPQTEGVAGSGLGLSIVRGLVELMEGEIWVESELGKGSTFSFSVPTRRAGTRGEAARVEKGSAARTAGSGVPGKRAR